VFGTAVTPTNNVPWTGIPLQPDPGLFYAKASVGTRDTNVFPLYGQYKFAGSVDGPLFPTNSIPLLIAAIGADGGRTGQLLGNGVTGTTPTSATTLNGSTIVGATSVTLTSASGYATGNYIQIDANVAGVTSSEVRQITLSGLVATVSALSFAHTTGCVISKVVAPFVHTIVRQDILDSLTVEKNYGGFQSMQFAGSRVNKFSMKLEATNTDAHFTTDIMSKNYVILDTPSPVSIVAEAPFMFVEYTFTMFGTNLVNVTGLTLDIENGLKDTFTMNQTHVLQYLTALSFKCSGTIDAIWNSLDDATYGYLTKVFNATSGALNITLTQPSGAGAISINLPQMRLSKNTDDVKLDGLIMTTLDWEAERQLSSSSTITATVSNATPTPL
jgi:hypothetical protein